MNDYNTIIGKCVIDGMFSYKANQPAKRFIKFTDDSTVTFLFEKCMCDNTSKSTVHCIITDTAIVCEDVLIIRYKHPEHNYTLTEIYTQVK